VYAPGLLTDRHLQQTCRHLVMHSARMLQSRWSTCGQHDVQAAGIACLLGVYVEKAEPRGAPKISTHDYTVCAHPAVPVMSMASPVSRRILGSNWHHSSAAARRVGVVPHVTRRCT
jgi:hypothetical protein